MIQMVHLENLALGWENLDTDWCWSLKKKQVSSPLTVELDILKCVRMKCMLLVLFFFFFFVHWFICVYPASISLVFYYKLQQWKQSFAHFSWPKIKCTQRGWGELFGRAYMSSIIQYNIETSPSTSQSIQSLFHIYNSISIVIWLFAGLILNNFNSNLSVLLALTQENNQIQVRCRSKAEEYFFFLGGGCGGGGFNFLYRWVFGYLYLVLVPWKFHSYSDKNTFITLINQVSRNIGWGLHLRCKFRLPDLAPSRGKLSLNSPSNMTLVSVKMHLPILSWKITKAIEISAAQGKFQQDGDDMFKLSCLMVGL